MKPRHLVLVLLFLVLVIGGALFLLGDDPAPVTPDGGTDTAAGVEEAPVEDAPTRKKGRRTTRRWDYQGDGSVTGRVLEYGTDRPISGVALHLEAGGRGGFGPDQRIDLTSGADGSFEFESVPNFDDWTLVVQPPAPLAETRLAGILVLEDRATPLGIIYLTPTFIVPGRVVDERGDPIPGASVKATREAPSEERSDLLRIIREFPHPTAAVDSAVTDEQGEFALAKVPPGSYDFEVSAPEYQLIIRRGVIVTPEVKDRPLEFVLPGGFALEGRVIREDGGNVEGITVVAFPEPANEMALIRIDRRFGTTDAEGNFRVEGLAAGRFWIGAAPEGRPYEVVTDLDIPGTTHVDIVMKGNAVLEGKVTDGDGNPIDKAAVYVVMAGDPPQVGNATSKSDGAYKIDGLLAGRVQLFMVTAEGYGTHPENFGSILRGRGSDLTIRAGHNVKDVQLGTGGTVRGVVLEQKTDQPIPGVKIVLASAASFLGGGKTTETDSEGRFELTGLPQGSSMLLASKDGYFQPGANVMSMGLMFQRSLSGGGGSDTGRGATIVISEPGEVIERELKLGIGSMISGRVLTPDGEPLPGAQVSMLLDPGGGMMRRVAALFPLAEPRLTDAEGRYSLPAPGPGMKAVVLAVAQGYLDTKKTDVKAIPGKPVEGLDIQMRNGATIEGRITADNGLPLEGAVVRWLHKTADVNEWSIRWSLRSAPASHTDAEGLFRIRHVETGDLIVQVDHAEYLSQSRTDLKGAEGKAVTLNLALTKGGRIAGKVVGPDGRPFAGAEVDIDLVGSSAREDDPYAIDPDDETSGADGSFGVSGLPAGQYAINALAPGYAPSPRLTVAPDGGTLTLQLQPAFTISGVLRDSEGAPVGGILVEAVLVTEGNRADMDDTRTAQDGTFEIADLPAGTYDLDINKGWRWGGNSGSSVIPQTVSGIAAGSQNVAVEVDTGLKIRGKVRRPDGTPPPEGWLSVQRIRQEGEDKSADLNVNQAVLEGDITVTGLTPGVYRVTVNVQGFASAPVEVEAGTEDLRIDLSKGGTITGIVVDEEGNPLGSAWVSVQTSSGANTQTKADGTFELKGVAAGVHTVNAGAQVDGEWRGGQVTEVELLEGGVTSDVRVTITRNP